MKDYNIEDSFDCGYHKYAKEKHKERVAKNGDRIQFAIEQFKKNNIEYVLKNEEIGHFHAWRKSDGQLFQFWAGIGRSHISKLLSIRNPKSLGG